MFIDGKKIIFKEKKIRNEELKKENKKKEQRKEKKILDYLQEFYKYYSKFN